MTDMRVTHIVTFNCNHVRYFEEDVCPRIGDSLWCPRCTKMVSVMTAPPEYRTRCISCGYGKAYGRGKIDAEMGAIRHRKLKPDHVVQLYDGKALTSTFANRDQIVIA